MEVDEPVANPTTIRERIDSALECLSNLSSSSKSRSEIIEDLSRDLSEYYGYIQEVTDFLLELFSPAECVEYMDASDKPRPLVIRTNTLKTTRKNLMEQLTKRGASVEPIDWSKVAIKVSESAVPIGATPEYLAGYYMLQSAASLNPVMALDPQPGEKVLDMSSAPGGKTSYVAQLMKNSGTVIANDMKPQRQKATVANLHRLGVKNATVCCYDGRKINHVFKGFDRVLLDAPCSGLGVISRDQSVKIQRTVKDIQRNAHLQKELLRAAVDAVDPKSPTGGVIVYSTCSISLEENEMVVDYILQKRFVRLVDTGLDVGKPGFTRHSDKRFHPSLALTRRFYPHVHNMDGFYVAKFKKYANGVRGSEDDQEKEEDEEQDGEEGDAEDDESNGEEESEQEEEESEEESEPEPVPEPKKSKKPAQAELSVMSVQKTVKEESPKMSKRKAAETEKDSKKKSKKEAMQEEVEAEPAMSAAEPIAKKQKKDKKAAVAAAEEEPLALVPVDDDFTNKPLTLSDYDPYYDEDDMPVRPRKRKSLRQIMQEKKQVEQGAKNKKK